MSMIRRFQGIARRHVWDAGFLILFAGALVIGAAPALDGMEKFAGLILPGMAAEASDEPAAAGVGLARLPIFDFAAPSRYSPQVLFPIQNHAFPVWLTARIGAGGVVPAALPTPGSSALRAAPVIAICIDDLGEDLAGTDKAMALPKTVALSFLPFAETTPFLAAEAGHRGHEVLAHVPMEAVGPTDPGPMTLKAGAPDIAARLQWSLARVPGIIGINNHEGSKFTADAAALTTVAEVLAAKHLFFFDSRTGADSKVVTVSHLFGVASAARDIFLDDTLSETAIRSQLDALVDRARTEGVAIAIGHPHDLTLKLLAAWLAQNHGVTLVPLSEAIRLKTEHMALAAR